MRPVRAKVPNARDQCNERMRGIISAHVQGCGSLSGFVASLTRYRHHMRWVLGSLALSGCCLCGPPYIEGHVALAPGVDSTQFAWLQIRPETPPYFNPD